jgi:squalene-hopene/tetraprenyl-beta-curcumene cyclase
LALAEHPAKIELQREPVKAILRGTGAAATCLVVGLLAACSHVGTTNGGSWNQKAAAAYLDQREGWWMKWPRASRDHGTFCVSCHTVMPYALSRPMLRAALREQAPSANERSLIEDVTKRVHLWSDVQPYYPQMAAQARGTEAVLNALVLASYDAQNGHLSDDTRAAFKNMWTTQRTTGDERGGWPWIQFGNEPWEAPDSAYYGTSLAAVAVGTAPENYRSMPEIQNNLKLLSEYLVRESPKQSLMNRVVLLWASAKLPGVLDSEQQKAIIDDVLSKQETDGGWSVSSLMETWKRGDGTPQVTESDGYATGLIVLTLEQTGVSPGDSRLERAMSWLVRNQSRWDGHWPAHSLNKRHYNPFYGGARFMDDAATAFAVLALTQAKHAPASESAVAAQAVQVR